MWNYRGQNKPPFAEQAMEGQESVWDYPRPPRLAPDSRKVEVFAGADRIANSSNTLRVCETASPPTFYIPCDDIDLDLLEPVSNRSFCEWKGEASYWRLAGHPEEPPVAWGYLAPRRALRALKSHLSFYPGRVDCFVGGEAVRAQQSEFYGGWITSEVVGPFKGDPGTGGW